MHSTPLALFMHSVTGFTICITLYIRGMCGYDSLPLRKPHGDGDTRGDQVCTHVRLFEIQCSLIYILCYSGKHLITSVVACNSHTVFTLFVLPSIYWTFTYIYTLLY